ncbi:MAG: Ldh family oxidoreductase [Nitrospinae bacterium]|nr:Ldh family oxidoreductase [Nitrospinota bacterium]
MTRVSAQDLTRVSQAIFESLGASAEEAALVARLLVDADLAGHDSHGVAQIPGYLQAYAEGLIVPGVRFRCEQETPATALVDGCWGFGQRLASEAMQRAIDKARLCGVSVVGAYHCCHVGRLGAYTEMAAEAGMVGIMAVNDGGGGQRVAPYGGLAGRLSTNPLSVGLPTGTAAPFILDISTSVVAEGQVRLKRVRGEQMPLGWMIDALGRLTTDPEQFFSQPPGSLLPLGESAAHKGYGLAVAVEVLAGIIGRAGYAQTPLPPYNNGIFLLALDIARFLPLEEFTAQVQDLLRYIKSCPRQSGIREILYPGEQAARTRDLRSREGIDLDSETWSRLRAIAQERDIPVPKDV